MQKSHIRIILALTCCLLWGSAFPCVKIGYEWLQVEGAASQILFAGYRFTLAGIFTFLLACIMERGIIKMKKEAVPYILRQGVIQTTLQYLFFYIGMAHTTGSKGSVINASNAFVSIAAAHFLIKSERMTWKKAMGCVLGLAGVVVINLSPGDWESGFQLLGEGMMILCAVTYGVSTVIMKQISHLDKPMTITAYQLIFGGGILIVMGLLTGGTVSLPDTKSMILLMYLALLSTVAFSLWTVLLKYNPVGKVAIFGFTIPIFGVFLSALILGEQAGSVKTIVALVLVCSGILFVNGKEKEPEQVIESENVC